MSGTLGKMKDEYKLQRIVEAKNGCVKLLKILGLIGYNESIINERMSRIIFKDDYNLIGTIVV